MPEENSEVTPEIAPEDDRSFIEGVHDKRVIYPQENGIVAILAPTLECRDLQGMIKDVPEGTPYQVVDVADIPTDRTFRNAWVYEE